MVRKGWFVFVGSFALGMVLGCSSNPYRPTLFHRNRDQVVGGPELGTPVMEGPYMGGNANGFPVAPNGTVVMPPNYAPPPQPIQGFPPNAPPQTGPSSPTVPQGPPPRVLPNTPTGRTG